MINLILAVAVISSSFYGQKIERWHDADTFFLTIPGVPDVFGLHRGVRVNGIDAPEMDGERACERRDSKRALEFAEHLIADRDVDLLFCQREKYDRLLCSIRIGDLDLAEELIKMGYVKLYSGGKKSTWRCLRKPKATPVVIQTLKPLKPGSERSKRSGSIAPDTD